MTVTKEPESEPVIKLQRGRGLRLSGPELFRIAFTLAMLVAVAVLTKPCSSAVSTFVMGIDGPGQGSAARKPGTEKPLTKDASGIVPQHDPTWATDDEHGAPNNLDDRFERLRPGMTESEVKSAIERAKAKAAPIPKRLDEGVE